MSDPFQMLLSQFGEMGNDVSVAIYQLPESVKGEIVLAVLSQLPSIKTAAGSGKCKLTGVRASDKGGGLVAFGGYMAPSVFEEGHAAIMMVPGVEFIVGAGAGCSTLPRTAFGSEAAGAHARAQAAKPWWKKIF